MMSNREDALTMITAAMAVAVQCGDIYLSAEIIADAGDKFGRSFVEKLLSEMVASDMVQEISVIPKDVLTKRAMLSLLRPLPETWMLTRN